MQHAELRLTAAVIGLVRAINTSSRIEMMRMAGRATRLLDGVDKDTHRIAVTLAEDVEKTANLF